MNREEYEHEILRLQKEMLEYKALYFQALHELRKANKGIQRLVRGREKRYGNGLEPVRKQLPYSGMMVDPNGLRGGQ